MTPEKIISVIEMYEKRLKKEGVPKERIDMNRTFGSLRPMEALKHAHYMCAGVKKYAMDPTKQRKAGSHLTAVQMSLSIAGWYTRGDLMNHNRP